MGRCLMCLNQECVVAEFFINACFDWFLQYTMRACLPSDNFPWSCTQFNSVTYWDNCLSGYQKYKNWSFQYLIWPLLVLITASSLLDILLIIF